MAGPGEQPLTVEQWGRRLRTRFQVGLIGWIRGERIEQNLEILAAVASKLEQIATRQSVFQLWWVVGAVIEALQEGALEGGVSVKRLLGLADREIKRLYELGESRYAQAPRSSFSIISSITSAAPRPRDRERSRCAPRSASPSSCRWMRASSRSAKISPRPPSNSCRRWRPRSARISPRSKMCSTSLCAAARASRRSWARRWHSCARSATRSVSWGWVSCAPAFFLRRSAWRRSLPARCSPMRRCSSTSRRA